MELFPEVNDGARPFDGARDAPRDGTRSGSTPQACPNCGGTGPMSLVYDAGSVPIHSCLLVDDQATARAFPRGRLTLVVCRGCGFFWNRSFEPRRMRYCEQYEETQAFSPRFRRFQTELIERLIDRYELRGKRILEIGCGKGDFLVELCQRGGNHGVGYDPSFRSERRSESETSRVTFVSDFFDRQSGPVEADFLCCRMTLEHIHKPLDFVSMVRDLIGDRDVIGDRRDVVVAFQVPDMRRILHEAAFWDVYYEHCSYFTADSLAFLFRQAGFEPLEVLSQYDEQYLLIEAVPCAAGGEPVPARAEEAEKTCRMADGFREQVAGLCVDWKRKLEELHAAGRRVVLWGSGSKAVAFLNALGIGDEVPGVVDINPHKHGKYLAGTGHRILAPQDLRGLRPDVIVAMNPIYLEEIQQDLDNMGVSAELLAL